MSQVPKQEDMFGYYARKREAKREDKKYKALDSLTKGGSIPNDKIEMQETERHFILFAKGYYAQTSFKLQACLDMAKHVYGREVSKEELFEIFWYMIAYLIPMEDATDDLISTLKFLRETTRDKEWNKEFVDDMDEKIVEAVLSLFVRELPYDIGKPDRRVYQFAGE